MFFSFAFLSPNTALVKLSTCEAAVKLLMILVSLMSLKADVSEFNEDKNKHGCLSVHEGLQTEAWRCLLVAVSETVRCVM